LAAPAAAIATGTVAGDLSAGAWRTLVTALQHPLYSNSTVQTVTHRARNGDIVERTRTTGYSITTGMVLGVVALMAIWEIGMNWTTANAEGGSSPIMTVLDIMNPTLWVAQEVASLFKGSPQQISVPPTAMAAIEQTVIQALLPVLATAQQGGGTLAATIGEALQKGVAQVSGGV